MRAILRVLLSALVAGPCLLLPSRAVAQAPTVVMYPGGPEVNILGPGQFQAFTGALVEWTVVLDNTLSPTDLVFDYYDVMDPLGITACGPDPVCPGVEHQELLCDPPNAPDPDGGTIFLCDPPLGRLDIRGIPVAAGSTSCVKFWTRLLPSSRTAGSVDNQGCVTVVTPVPSSTITRPTNSAAPACFPAPGSGLAGGCSRLLVPNIEPPSFTNQKTASVEDINANGVTDVGDRITWTVVVTNTGLESHDGYLHDDIPAGTTFVDITDNPDGACALAGARIECSVLTLAGGEARTLSFRTDIDCSIFTDDDTSSACNTAFVCTDPGRISCGPSDPDLVPPLSATCVDVPLPDLTASTKSWGFEDLDADGSVSDGDRVNFTLTVRNDGRGTATGLELTDVLDVTCLDETTVSAGAANFDAATDTVTWLAGDLISGQVEQTMISALVIDSGAPCCNQASITHASRMACALPGPGVLTDDPGTVAPDDPACVAFGPQPILVAEKDFVLSNDADGDGVPSTGDELTFTITVSNIGGGVATAVALDDLIAPCWTGFTAASVVITGEGTDESTEQAPPATPNRVRVTAVGGADGLAPLGAEIVTISFPLLFAPGWAACCNEAHVTWAESATEITTDDPTTPTPGDPACTQRVAPTATLEVTKVAEEGVPDGCLLPGEDVRFTITITARDADASLVQLTDVVTDTAGLFEAVDGGGGTIDPAGDEVHWNIAGLDMGVPVTRNWIGRFVCSAMPGASIEDTATAFAVNAPVASSAPVTSTVSAPDLRISKTFTYADADSSGSLSAGDTAQYVITLENQGDCAAASVVITDALDPDLDAAAAVATGAPVTGPPGTLTWNETTAPELASLAPGASVSYDLSAPVLLPATNPAPLKDGVVENAAEATAASTPSCPLVVRSALLSEVIDVDTAILDVKLVVTDADTDGCYEIGEVLTFTVSVTGVGGASDNTQVVLSFTDAADLLSVVDAGGGSVAGNPETITWDLGTLAADTPRNLVAELIVRCDGADGVLFEARADATSSNLPAGFAVLDRLLSSAPLLDVSKSLTWGDDGDGVVEAGESLKYEIVVRNAGSCQVRDISVIDRIDPDLDIAAMTYQPIADNDGAGGLTWFGLGLNPGESIVLVIEVPVLDPATNPDPAANGFVLNDVTALVNLATGCPAVPFSASAPEIELGTTFGVVRLLRNDFITCRTDAFATMKNEFMRRRPLPQECSDPPAVDPLHRGTQVIDDALTPTLFSGDASPASTFTRCPQTLVGFGRVLVFYELDEPPPACIVTLRVRKSGGDVEVSW